MFGFDLIPASVLVEIIQVQHFWILLGKILLCRLVPNWKGMASDPDTVTSALRVLAVLYDSSLSSANRKKMCTVATSIKWNQRGLYALATLAPR